MKKIVILNIICGVLLLAAMPIVALSKVQAKISEKVNAAVCQDCGAEAILEGRDVPSDYVCPGVISPEVRCNSGDNKNNYSVKTVSWYEKYKVRYCTYCKTLAELDENNKVREDYVCPGTAVIDITTYNKNVLIASEVVVDNNGMVSVPCSNLKPKYKMELRTNENFVDVLVCNDCGTQIQQTEHNEVPKGYQCPGLLQSSVACMNTAQDGKFEVKKITATHKETINVAAFLLRGGESSKTALIMPFLVFVCGVGGAVVCLWKRTGTWQGVLPVIAGIAMAVAYLLDARFQPRSMFFVLSCAILLIISGGLLVYEFIKNYRQ